MKNALAALICMFLFSFSSYGRNRAFGWCEQGKQTIIVGTTQSSPTTPVQRSYPSCTVTVYKSGTLDLANLYADDNNTPKANPFNAGVSGFWFFYADQEAYDIQFSGGGIPAPYTYGDVRLFDPKRPQESRLACWFAGSDPGQQIQAAINDLPSAGGFVDARCYNGSYTTSTTININKPVMILFGRMELTSSASPAVNIASNGVTLLGMGGGYNSVIVSNVVLDGNPLTNVIQSTTAFGPDDVLIDGMTLITPTKTYYNQPVDEAAYYLGDAIYFSGRAADPTKRLTIRNSVWTTGQSGFICDWCENADIHDNVAMTTDSISLTQIGIFNGQNNIVHDNFGLSSKYVANFTYGRRSSFDSTAASGTDGLTVVNNQAIGQYSHEVANAINVNRYLAQGNTWIITDLIPNPFNGDVGIPSGFVAACYLLGDTTTITYSRINISYNTIVYPDSLSNLPVFANGIATFCNHLDSPNATMEDVVIHGNIIKSLRGGIGVTGSVRNYSVTGNNITFSAVALVGGDGIYTFGPTTTEADSPKYGKISGNMIVKGIANGMSLRGNYIEMEDNTVIDTAGACIFSDLYLVNSSIVNNKCYGNGSGPSFNWTVNGTNNLVRDNRLIGNGSGNTITGYSDTTSLTQPMDTQTRWYDAKLWLSPIRYPSETTRFIVRGPGAIIGRLERESSFGEFDFRVASNTTPSSVWHCIGSHGTLASPASSVVNDEFCRIQASGFDSSGTPTQRIAGDHQFITTGVTAGHVTADWALKLDDGASLTQAFRVKPKCIVIGASPGTTGIQMCQGSGTPEGSLAGTPGDSYFDYTNGLAYLKKTGFNTNTGWKAYATVP